MKLLAPTQPAELPADALLARLRFRRSVMNLTADGAEGPVTDPFWWVYKRLNRRLRQQLEPFLELHAMRNLALALRYALAGETPPATILKRSLLTEPLQHLTTTSADGETRIARLEAALGNDYPFVSGLTSTYRKQGPGGVEQQLASGILEHGLHRTRHALLKKTLAYLVDMRNCLMINKLWRWQVSQAPELTFGGTLATSSLQHIWAAHDSGRLARLIGQLAGEAVRGTEAVNVEQSLLKGLTRLLRRAGRDPMGLAVIIEYLWRAQLAVHNQQLRQSLAIDREELLEEVLLL